MVCPKCEHIMKQCEDDAYVYECAHCRIKYSVTKNKWEIPNCYEVATDFIFESCNVKTLLNANDYGKYWLPVGTPPVKFYGQITKCDMNKFMDEVQELYKTGVFNKVTEDVSELYKTGNFNVTTKTEYGTRRDIKIDDKATLPSSNTLIFYDEQIAKDVLISLIHEGYRVSTKLVKDEKGTLCVEMIYFAKPIDE